MIIISKNPILLHSYISTKSLRVFLAACFTPCSVTYVSFYDLLPDLIERLEKLRQEDGRTDAIGKDIVEWVRINCINQMVELYPFYKGLKCRCQHSGWNIVFNCV